MIVLNKDELNIYFQYQKDHEDFKKILSYIKKTRVTYDRELIKVKEYEIFLKEGITVEEDLKEFKHIDVIVRVITK